MKTFLLILFFVQAIFAAEVSELQLQEAKNILSKIDYLGFSYRKGGCESKAHLAAMELMVKDIPVSAVAVKSKTNIVSSQNDSWDYHVALAFLVQETKQFLIFDPLFSNSFLSFDKWKQHLGLTSFQARTFAGSLSIFDIIKQDTLNSNSLTGINFELENPDVDFVSSKVIKNLSDAPAFKYKNVIYAFQNLLEMFPDIFNSSEERRVATQKLISRVSEMAKILKKQKRILDSEMAVGNAKLKFNEVFLNRILEAASKELTK